MTFKGLFIGIDRYKSPHINWLSCAKRDAVALHSLFSDNVEGSLVLLTDDQATRSNIRSEFEKLFKCNEEDVVFIAFSGHGSETHELITYDSEITDLPNSAIPLDVITEWFSQIPAKRIIFILDCCFSGAIGSKVLKVDFASRNLPSAENLLTQMSGDGRLIYTASTALEPAWEINRYKHGLLTYHLIEALTGVEEVQEHGKIDIYSLLRYVTERVISSASQVGKIQQPTMRGKVDGLLTFPTFKRGKNFYANFPETEYLKVSADITSLKSYGFPIEIVDIWKASIPQINELQIDAINEFGVLKGEHLVVSAPTSSGKTMIGELSAIKGSIERQRTIFLFPLKALVNDKHKHFNILYKSYGIYTIQATGDSNDEVPKLMKGQYDICLMTYEKFSAMVLGFPHILEQVNLVVVDEAQMIVDKSRGVNLEFILTLIKIRRQQGVEPQLIALSAVIGDTNGLEKWLGARLLRRETRPVPLNEGIIKADGTFRYLESENKNEKLIQGFTHKVARKGGNQDWIIPLVRKLVDEGKQIIVFRTTKGDARGSANYLSESLGLSPSQKVLDALPKGDPSIISEDLRKCLSGGVAFHTADLDKYERSLIEEEFRKKQSTIRVISATTTLAMGVNTPAEAVILTGLEHPGYPPVPYSVAEYKNIVGRAGRLGYATRGSSYLLALTPKKEHEYWTKYLNGNPEDLSSLFLAKNTDPRTLIVKVLAAAINKAKNKMVGLSSKEIVRFLEFSFGVFQQSHISPGWKWSEDELLRSLENLQQHNLIKQTNNKYKLTKLGWLAGQGGVEVESIIRLISVLNLLSPTEVTDPALIALTQITIELDQVYMPINNRGAQREHNSWLSELQQQNISDTILQKLRNIAETKQIAMRFKKAVACLLWITKTPLIGIEGILTRHGNRFNGIAGAVRSASSRTHDLLGTVAKVAEIIHPDLQLEERINKLFVRLEVGISPEIYDVANAIGSTFSRSDYLSLVKSNLSDMSVLKSASDEDMLSALGHDKSKLSILKKAIENYFTKINSDTADLSAPSLPSYES